MSFICLGFGCFTGTISDCLCQNVDTVVTVVQIVLMLGHARKFRRRCKNAIVGLPYQAIVTNCWVQGQLAARGLLASCDFT